MSCEFKGVADVIVISGEVLGTTVVTAVEASTSPDDGETSGLNTDCGDHIRQYEPPKCIVDGCRHYELVIIL